MDTDAHGKAAPGVMGGQLVQVPIAVSGLNSALDSLGKNLADAPPQGGGPNWNKDAAVDAVRKIKSTISSVGGE